MAINHTWKVTKLVQKNDGSGLVIQVFYKVQSTDDEYYYSYMNAGNIELETENISNFIPYQDLTEGLVIEWVKNKLGPSLGNHEQINIDWINSIKNPPQQTIKVEKLPWVIEEIPPEIPPENP